MGADSVVRPQVPIEEGVLEAFVRCAPAGSRREVAEKVLDVIRLRCRADAASLFLDTGSGLRFAAGTPPSLTSRRDVTQAWRARTAGTFESAHAAVNLVLDGKDGGPCDVLFLSGARVLSRDECDGRTRAFVALLRGWREPLQEAAPRVQIESAIPAGDPRKAAVEGAVARSLEERGGEWAAVIVSAPTVIDCWVVWLEGPCQRGRCFVFPGDDTVRIQQRIGRALDPAHPAACS